MIFLQWYHNDTYVSYTLVEIYDILQLGSRFNEDNEMGDRHNN